MDERDWLAERFEEHRTRLRAVAYRMLGSLSEADDAVQEAWLRLSRSDAERGREPRRMADDGRRARVAEHAALAHGRGARSRSACTCPSRSSTAPTGRDPEHEALLADSVGLALLVVLETLSPAERLAFVLHDMFAVPFDEIAPIVDRSPEAARQLASRARRRVQGESTVPDADLDAQREVVDAFLAASRDGDFDALLAVLDPDVVLRADLGPLPAGGSREVRGAPRRSPARRSATRGSACVLQPALVNGVAGARLDARRRAVLGRRLHGQGREDRRDRHPRRPRAPAPARPDDPRRLAQPGGSLKVGSSGSATS